MFHTVSGCFDYVESCDDGGLCGCVVGRSDVDLNVSFDLGHSRVAAPLETDDMDLSYLWVHRSVNILREMAHSDLVLLPLPLYQPSLEFVLVENRISSTVD